VGRDTKIQANLYYLPQFNIVCCFIENTKVSEKVDHMKKLPSRGFSVTMNPQEKKTKRR
jgi:hypothetical protein